MEEAITNIGINLLSTGIVTATARSQQELQNIFRQRTFSTEIDAIGIEFHRTLQDAISEVDERSVSKELTGVAHQWESIIEHLAERVPDEEAAAARGSERIFFKNEEDAVDQISYAIAAVDGYDLDTTPQLKQEIKHAVTIAYREALATFTDRLSETGLTETFLAETNLEALTVLGQLAEKLEELEERLAPTKYYDRFDLDQADHQQVSEAVAQQPLDYTLGPDSINIFLSA